MNMGLISTIVMAFVGVFLAVLGFLLKRSLSAIDTNIEKIFGKLDSQTKEINDLKYDLIKNYITKDTCERKHEWSGLERRT